MDRVIPMSWLNQILLVFSIVAAVLSLIIQEWAGLTLLPIYVSIFWAIFITIISIWLSCYLLRLTLKANSPVALGLANKWICERLTNYFKLSNFVDEGKSAEVNCKNDSEGRKNANSTQEHNVKSNNNATARRSRTSEIILPTKDKLIIENMTRETNAKCIEIWYQNISNDKSFPEEAQDILNKFLTRLVWRISLMDKVKLTNKLANILLLHLKEYRRYEHVDRRIVARELIL